MRGWLFADTLKGTKASVALYTLVESARDIDRYLPRSAELPEIKKTRGIKDHEHTKVDAREV